MVSYPFYKRYEGGGVIWIPFCLLKMVIWRYKYLIYHHVASEILSLLCFWVHIQDSLPLGMKLMRSLVFDKVFVDTGEYFFMYVLMLIWYILAVKCIAKISFGNAFNNLIDCLHVYIFYLYSFTDLFNFVLEYSLELVSLW